MIAGVTGVIPIYINNFNWLTCTRNLAAYCAMLPGANVIIVDNASTYPPLLEWYRTACPHKVVRLTENGGEHAPWNCGAVLATEAHRTTFGSDHYVVTDSDLSLTGCPLDLLSVLAAGLRRYPTVNKVGVSLEIDDLPGSGPLTTEVRGWERQFWSNRRDGEFFQAGVDTTFALYSIETPHSAAKCSDSNSLRSDRPYTARHLPWYISPQTATEEELFYFATARFGAWGSKWKQAARNCSHNDLQ